MGEEFLGDDNTVNVHMSRLRNKLGSVNNKNYEKQFGEWDIS